MLAEIITIGDELLIGQVVDTNSAWMAQQLNLAGISVKQITSVSDDQDHILTALEDAQERADIVLMTGGLGPTKDDITKKTLCAYFKTSLVFNEEMYKNVERLFFAFGKEVTPVNRLQAEVPAGCIPLLNTLGTAPGMWFEKNGKVVVALPGVPYEMKALMLDKVLPRLVKKYALPHILHRTVLTQGIGESFLAGLIADWENSLSEHGIKLAYLPSPGMVRLRLSVKGKDAAALKNTVDRKIEELRPLIAEYIYGFEEYGKARETFADLVGKLLREKGGTLCTAESCTGGYIAHLITQVPGSSAYFKGSVVAYANEIKTMELDVPADLIEKHGAVSKEVAERMALHIRKKFGTHYSVAVTGIAGPGGGSDEKPVGTVWIAVASEKGMVSEKFRFGNSRERNIRKAADTALNMLRKVIESVPQPQGGT
jgi:nicotinamide-nucleotide amidase